MLSETRTNNASGSICHSPNADTANNKQMIVHRVTLDLDNVNLCIAIATMKSQFSCRIRGKTVRAFVWTSSCFQKFREPCYGIAPGLDRRCLLFIYRLTHETNRRMSKYRPSSISRGIDARGVRHQLESRTLRLESQMESRILPWNLESCPSNKSN